MVGPFPPRLTRVEFPPPENLELFSYRKAERFREWEARTEADQASEVVRHSTVETAADRVRQTRIASS